ncbi:MAG: hypothetical protein ABIO39_12235, partial [Caulobacteraceae bacterium]
LSNLQSRRIGFVSIGAEDLLAASIEAPESLSALTSALNQPNVDPRTLRPVLVGCLVVLWCDPQHLHIREKLTNMLLHGLVVSRAADSIEILSSVVPAVYREIKTLRFPKNICASAFSDAVEGFFTGHFLRSAMLGNG